MCCLYPLFRYLQSHVEPEHDVICMVIATEIIRWFTMAIPIFLSVWQYAEILGYTVFIEGMDTKGQFWMVTTLIFVGASLFLYLPLKILCSRYWKNARYTHGWRPSIVMYIICCALPCLLIILIAVDKAQDMNPGIKTMDPATTAVIQTLVMGMTITEWMAKMREEQLTFDLTSSMATDFFFAYDVIDFFMLSAHEQEIYHSPWLYITFIFGYISMLKYIPNQPFEMNENGSPKGAVTCILVSMFCNDIPFLVVRTTTMAQYGLLVSDVIHPAKNVAMICLGLTQLYIIYQNWTVVKTIPGAPEKFYEHRCVRHSSMMSQVSVAGNSRRAKGGDMVDDDCTCEDMEEVQAKKVSMQERWSGSSSRVSPSDENGHRKKRQQSDDATAIV